METLREVPVTPASSRAASLPGGRHEPGGPRNPPKKGSAHENGIPKERRPGETRVAATPETVKKLVKAGHEVLVEREAGVASDITDAAYEEAGAQIVDTAGAFGAELVARCADPWKKSCPS